MVPHRQVRRSTRLFGSCLLLIGLFTLAGLALTSALAKEASKQLRIEVHLEDRQLKVFEGEERARSEPVAVGREGFETPTGNWQIYQIDINPDWTPPDEEWAEDNEPKDPGQSGNPMGRARLIYDPPYSIHGTEEVDSLGEAASHGSLRLGNDAILELAEKILRQDEAWEGDEWFGEMLDDETTLYD